MTLEFIDNFNKQLQIEQEKLKQRQLERKNGHCLTCLDFRPKPVDINQVARIVTQQPEKRIYLVTIAKWKEIGFPKLQQKTDSQVTIVEEGTSEQVAKPISCKYG